AWVETCFGSCPWLAAFQSGGKQGRGIGTGEPPLLWVLTEKEAITITPATARPRQRRMPRLRLFGGVGEWLNPADCKSARLAYAGSNPAPSTNLAVPPRAVAADGAALRGCRVRASSAGSCLVARLATKSESVRV